MHFKGFFFYFIVFFFFFKEKTELEIRFICDALYTLYILIGEKQILKKWFIKIKQQPKILSVFSSDTNVIIAKLSLLGLVYTVQNVRTLTYV